MKNHHFKNAFTEKACAFSHELLRSCLLLTSPKVSEFIFTKMFYMKLISSSQLLEDFLDYHGAKNNRNWYFFRELAAGIRHLSKAGYSLKHVINRINFYEFSELPEFIDIGNVTLQEFIDAVNLTLDFFTQTLTAMAPVIIEEARRLEIPIPTKGYSFTRFPRVVSKEILAYNINDHNKDIQKKNIVKVANDYLNLAKYTERFEFFEPYSIKDIYKMIPVTINEVKTRRFEMRIHNIQSSFDTYIVHGGFKFGSNKLKSFRRAFSLGLYLLQTMGCLLHFYERHLYEVGYKSVYKQTYNRISSLIDKEIILDRTINFGLFYVCNFFSVGKRLAKEILNENVERSSITVGIPVKLGFHSRPSLLVAKIVQHYGGQVEMCVGDDRFDASSVLDIQWAGGKIQKENFSEVIFEGDIRSLQDIAILSKVNYGEDIMGKGIPLPDNLEYLK